MAVANVVNHVDSAAVEGEAETGTEAKGDPATEPVLASGSEEVHGNLPQTAVGKDKGVPSGVPSRIAEKVVTDKGAIAPGEVPAISVVFVTSVDLPRVRPRFLRS